MLSLGSSCFHSKCKKNETLERFTKEFYSQKTNKTDTIITKFVVFPTLYCALKLLSNNKVSFCRQHYFLLKKEIISAFTNNSICCSSWIFCAERREKLWKIQIEKNNSGNDSFVWKNNRFQSFFELKWNVMVSKCSNDGFRWKGFFIIFSLLPSDSLFSKRTNRILISFIYLSTKLNSRKLCWKASNEKLSSEKLENELHKCKAFHGLLFKNLEELSKFVQYLLKSLLEHSLCMFY